MHKNQTFFVSFNSLIDRTLNSINLDMNPASKDDWIQKCINETNEKNDKQLWSNWLNSLGNDNINTETPNTYTDDIIWDIPDTVTKNDATNNVNHSPDKQIPTGMGQSINSNHLTSIVKDEYSDRKSDVDSDSQSNTSDDDNSSSNKIDNTQSQHGHITISTREKLKQQIVSQLIEILKPIPIKIRRGCLIIRPSVCENTNKNQNKNKKKLNIGSNSKTIAKSQGSLMRETELELVLAGRKETMLGGWHHTFGNIDYGKVTLIYNALYNRFDYKKDVRTGKVSDNNVDEKDVYQMFDNNLTILNCSNYNSETFGEFIDSFNSRCKLQWPKCKLSDTIYEKQKEFFGNKNHKYKMVYFKNLLFISGSYIKYGYAYGNQGEPCIVSQFFIYVIEKNDKLKLIKKYGLNKRYNDHAFVVKSVNYTYINDYDKNNYKELIYKKNEQDENNCKSDHQMYEIEFLLFGGCFEPFYTSFTTINLKIKCNNNNNDDDNDNNGSCNYECVDFREIIHSKMLDGGCGYNDKIDELNDIFDGTKQNIGGVTITSAPNTTVSSFSCYYLKQRYLLIFGCEMSNIERGKQWYSDKVFYFDIIDNTFGCVQSQLPLNMCHLITICCFKDIYGNIIDYHDYTRRFFNNNKRINQNGYNGINNNNRNNKSKNNGVDVANADTNGAVIYAMGGCASYDNENYGGRATDTHVKIIVERPLLWVCERQIWIGLYKNDSNDKCMIHKLPKDIICLILKMCFWSIFNQLEMFG